MDKKALLESLHESHLALLEAVEGLNEEQLSHPGVCGDWSIKDILAHLLMWEAETIKLLFQAQQGKTPLTVHFSQISDDEQNAIWYQQTKNRPLQAVWDDFLAIRAQTIRRVDAFSDEQLNNPKLFPWLKGKKLTEVIKHSILEHDEEHRHQIETWRSKLN